jgi:hypothetical protein
VAGPSSATALQLPPADLHRRHLPILTVGASSLTRISRHTGGEPYFGKSGGNRFDDPAGAYGVCYLGHGTRREAVLVAFAESVLHDQTATNGGFDIATTELDSRWVVRFSGSTRLRVADLTGAALKLLGLDGRVSTDVPYDVPQAWSAAIASHPDLVDGIAYVSRHYNTGTAVALFERSGPKLKATSYTAVSQSVHFGKLVSTFALRPY